MRSWVSEILATRMRKNTQKSEESICHQVFLHVEYRRAKIDEQAGFNPPGSEVTEQLGYMLACHSSNSLQLNDELMRDQQVSEKLS